jgi:hypothetical protein
MEGMFLLEQNKLNRRWRSAIIFNLATSKNMTMEFGGNYLKCNRNLVLYCLIAKQRVS